MPLVTVTPPACPPWCAHRPDHGLRDVTGDLTRWHLSHPHREPAPGEVELEQRDVTAPDGGTEAFPVRRVLADHTRVAVTPGPLAVRGSGPGAAA